MKMRTKFSYLLMLLPLSAGAEPPLQETNTLTELKQQLVLAQQDKDKLAAEVRKLTDAVKLLLNNPHVNKTANTLLDIVGMLNEKIDSEKKQLKKAEAKEKEIEQNIEKASQLLNANKDRLQNLSDTLEEKQAELTALKTQLEPLMYKENLSPQEKQALTTLQDDYAAKATEVQDLTEKLNEWKTSTENKLKGLIEDSTAGLAEILKGQKKRLDSGMSTLKTIEAAQQEAEDKVNALQEQLHTHIQEAEQSGKALSQEQQEEIIDLQNQLEAAEKEKTSLEQTKQSLEQELTIMKEQLETHYKELEQKQAAGEEELQSLKDQLAETQATLQQGVADQQAKEALEQQLRELQERTREAEQKISNLMGSADSQLSQTIGGINAELEGLKEENPKLSAQIEALKVSLEEGLEEYRELKDQSNQFNQKARETEEVLKAQKAAMKKEYEEKLTEITQAMERLKEEKEKIEPAWLKDTPGLAEALANLREEYEEKLKAYEEARGTVSQEAKRGAEHSYDEIVDRLGEIGEMSSIISGDEKGSSSNSSRILKDVDKSRSVNSSEDLSGPSLNSSISLDQSNYNPGQWDDNEIISSQGFKNVSSEHEFNKALNEADSQSNEDFSLLFGNE